MERGSSAFFFYRGITEKNFSSSRSMDVSRVVRTKAAHTVTSLGEVTSTEVPGMRRAGAVRSRGGER